MKEVVLDIPGTPPSYNVTAHAHWRTVRKHKQQWQQDCLTALLVARAPRRLGSVMASVRLEFTQRRKRDEDNFKVTISKALGDALVAGAYIPDDTPDHYRFGAVELVAPAPAARTLITIAYTTN